ncbi:hypothetical protein B7494_g8034 [Chlorociboria aeruginascens]|nr:hypothetical protein B7494_g8034 [Chlorociboria aeruginascens]
MSAIKKSSNLSESWEQYMPMKGDIFNKAIKFLQALGIVKQCQEEGWNDLSDKILQALRVPFRSIISIPFEPDQQSQMEYSATQGPVDASMHRPTPSMLGDMGTNNVLPKLSEIGLLEIKWPNSHLSQPVSIAKYNRGHNENWPVPEQHFSQELRGASYLTSVPPPSQGTMNKQSTTKAIRATTNTAKTDPFVHFSPDDIPWIAQRTHKQGENGERAPKKQRVNSLPQDASWNDGVRPTN